MKKIPEELQANYIHLYKKAFVDKDGPKVEYTFHYEPSIFRKDISFTITKEELIKNTLLTFISNTDYKTDDILLKILLALQ